MTIEYTIKEIRRHENEINELITSFAEAYRDYERSKEFCPEWTRTYIESFLKDLKKLSNNLKTDAETLEKWDKYIKES